MSSASQPTRVIFAPSGSSPREEEARAYLQDRLAFLGKAYAAIGLVFFLLGNLIALWYSASVAKHLTSPSFWTVPAVSALYLVQWALCQRGPLAFARLRTMDATTTVLAALFNSLMIFGTGPGELPGLAYTRAMLLVVFGLIARAIVIPSSARRSLLLGLVGTAFTIAMSQIWYATQQTPVPAILHAVQTTLWCLGAVVISALTSRVIYGLREQVRDARTLGQYTLLEQIGEGGMGVVYRASHAMLRRPTAVKLLLPGAAARLEGFEREVQLTSRLTHPNTITVFDYGRTPDGIFYYAMEYLEGLNLDDLVRFDGPQPAGRVVHILRQVCGSLSEAHAVGLVHRDIKPANVILVPERGGAPDVVKVVDFGLVKHAHTNRDVTRELQIAGTPHYFSPETLSCPASVGPQSDLYSLGCVGYFLVTGHHVFDGRTVVEICDQHLHAAPVAPATRLGRRVPEAFSNLLLACLEKTPERRPASAQALLQLLANCHDVDQWSNESARNWWKERGATIRQRPLASENTGAGSSRSTATGKVSAIPPTHDAS